MIITRNRYEILLCKIDNLESRVRNLESRTDLREIKYLELVQKVVDLDNKVNRRSVSTVKGGV